MYSFLNFNEYIRTFLTKIYENIISKYDTDDSIKKIYQKMNYIKEKNEFLYENILGLAFIDRYSMLKEKLDKLSEDEVEILETFESINTLDDLVYFVSESEELLNYLLVSSVQYKLLNKKNKAKLLIQLDDEYIYKFNKFHFLEKSEFFKNRTIEDLLLICCHDNSSLSESILYILEILEIQLIGNEKNYEILILSMLKTVYKWNKACQIINKELTEKQYFMIDIIENYDIEQIIIMYSCNKNDLESLIFDFIKCKTNEIDTKLINSIYETCVDDKIKTKLKEV